LSLDDFEVAIFLTPQTSRHSILTKQKQFSNKAPLKSNSNKLTNWLTTGTTDKPIDVDDDAPIIVQEEDDGGVNMEAIPEAPNIGGDINDSLFVHSSSEDDDEGFFQTQRTPPSARRRRRPQPEDPPDDTGEGEDSDRQGPDNKKNLGLQTQYDGFSIYGSMLCLIVKRRGGPSGLKENGPSTSQAMMENWVSTQVMMDLEEDG
jgi:hypothetical protein